MTDPDKKPDRRCEICGEPYELEWSPRFGGKWIRKHGVPGHEACDHELDLRAQRAHAEEQEKVRIAAFYRASNMPVELFESRTFERYEVTADNRRAFDVLNSWASTDKWGVLLQGNPGTGKSHLMLAFANKWIPQGVSIFFKNVSSMFDELRAGYDTGDFAQKMEDLKKRALIVLDDIGAEKPTEWVEEKLFQILDHRLNHGLPTFFTTNCSTAFLKGQFHERITSRIKELAIIVTVGGEDRRNRRYEQRLIEVNKRISERARL